MSTIPENESPDTNEMSTEAAKRLWDFGWHQDKIFNDRLSFFLTFQTVLLAIVGVLYRQTAVDKPQLYLISTIGLVIALLWLLVQAKQRYIHLGVRKRLQQLEPEFDKIVSEWNDWRIPIVRMPFSITWVLAYLIPILVLSLWAAIVILVYSL